MTDKTKRVQLKRTKGWRMPANTVKVDRSTKWGNPYREDEIGRERAVALHRAAVIDGICTHGGSVSHVASMLHAIGVNAEIEHLIGKDLACWCPLDKPCHADTLLEAAALAEQRRNDLTPAGETEL